MGVPSIWAAFRRVCGCRFSSGWKGLPIIGAKFNLNANWFLDATYRYIWLNKLHTVNAHGVGEDIRDSGHMITVGLNYRL